MASESERNRQPAAGDFDRHDAYRAACEMVDFIYELEDRFPEDELPVLFQRLRSSAVDLGARIAEGVGRDGLDERGGLSARASDDTRARLSELRHYVLTSRQRFFLDEHHVAAFDDLERKLRASLSAGPAA